MSEATRKITEGLQHAMRAETDGYHFYSMASKNIQDAKGREVFEALAQEELSHLRYLKIQFNSYNDAGGADTSARLGARRDLSGEHPIFSDDFKIRIKNAHFEMSALSIAILLELNSERYYREQAQATGDPDAKDFFNQLADWESGHYHALLQQQESLKEDYWAAGGFAPF